MVKVLAVNWLPDRFQVYNVLLPVLRCMGRLLGMHQEWTFFAGCVYAFHQIAAGLRPGVIGEGNSLLYKAVKELDLAECRILCATHRQEHRRQLLKLCLHDPIRVHCEQNDLQSVLQGD